MSITLDSTLATDSANSYCTVSYGDDFFFNHYDSTKTSTWQNLLDQQKQNLLVSACYTIEQFKFTLPTDFNNRPWFFDPTVGRLIMTSPTMLDSYRYNYWQFLQFPRNIDIHRDGTVYMPERMMMAQCEQAIYLATVDRTNLQNAQMGVIRDEISVGGIVSAQRIDPTHQGNLLSPDSRQYIAPYLLKRNTRLSRSG